MMRKLFIFFIFILLLGILTSTQDAILNSSFVKNWLNKSNNDYGDKYKLTCDVGVLDLKNTSLLDRSRFVGKKINLEVDTNVGVYSDDYQNKESDVIILHGLFPDAKFSMKSDNLLSWKNELIFNDNNTLYKYDSNIRKKNHTFWDKIQKKDMMILNIVISEYDSGRKPPLKNFDEWKKSLNVNSKNKTENEPKIYKGLFDFRFECIKSEI